MPSLQNHVTELMEYEYLELLRKKNPAWRLLASPHASLAAAFLYQEFIAKNKRSVSETELSAKLDFFIYKIHEGHDDDLLPRSGCEYLERWADDEHSWLRKFYPPGQDEAHFDMTSSAQKAIDCLLSLLHRVFIGTESRLLTVFDLIQQIVERSEADPVLRIAELNRQKEKIEQEIGRIEAGKVELLEETQVKDRLWQAFATAREILSDFRSVEQNFRELDRGLREKIAVWEGGKGELLAAIFEEQDGIAHSEQGKSFASFWNFLLSSSHQEVFEKNVEKVLAMSVVRNMDQALRMRNILYEWIEAGAHVQDTIALLSQQLRRYVDENFLKEERRIVELVREIEGRALQVRHQPPDEAFMEVDGCTPKFSLPMDRPLFSPPEQPEIRTDKISEGNADIAADALFSQVYIDKDELKSRIRYLLQVKETVSLGQVIAQHPLQHGLTELLTYLVIAGESDQGYFTENEEETVQWIDENGNVQRASMPKVCFGNRTMAKGE